MKQDKNIDIQKIYDKYSNEQIGEFEKIAETRCCWNCKIRNKNCSDCETFLKERDEIVLLDYIRVLQDRIAIIKSISRYKTKQQKISIRAIGLLCESLGNWEND